MHLRSILFFLILLLFNGCAFFNTIYNGRQSYREGQTLEQRLKDEGQSPEAIARAVERHYQRAFEKGNKALNYYPRSVRHHDAAYFLRGTASYRLGNHSLAISSFLALQGGFPDSRWVPPSWLYIAKAYRESGDYYSAVEAFQYVIDNYPRLNADLSVSMMLAEITTDLQGRGAAIQLLEEMFESASSPLEQVQIIYRLAVHYRELSFYERALYWLEKLPGHHRSYTDLYYSCLYEKLLAYRELGMYDEGRELARSLLSIPAYFSHTNDLYFYLATLYLHSGDFDSAYDEFERIVNRSGLAMIVGESWFNMSEISIDIRNNISRGREELDSAAQYLGESPKLMRLVNDRRSGLDRVGLLKDSLKNTPRDSIDRWDVLFEMAESYWMDARLGDSAISIYNNILEDEISDSLRGLTLYSKAWILREVVGDTLTSDSILNQLIFDFKGTDIAQESQRLLDLPITVKTRRDSAWASFVEVERAFFESERFKLDHYYAYMVVALNYADIPEVAARALYAAGKIAPRRETRGEAVDTAAAKVFVYLCREFPDSKECLAARPLLRDEELQEFITFYEDLLEESVSAKDVDSEVDMVVDQEVAETEPEIVEPIEEKLSLPDFKRWLL